MSSRWLAFSMLLLVATPASAQDLSRYQRPAAREAIARITREAIDAYEAHRPYRPSVPASLADAAGVFVTLSRDGRTRACWGSVSPRQSSLALDLATTAAQVLYKDYRQPPVRPAELAGLVARVSIVGPLEPVGSVSQLLPRRYGLLVSAHGRGGVLLPGEAATAAWQVWECRRKAGIPPRAQGSMVRFETAVVGPIPLSGR
ncbi:MAG TPA: AMMECR1 domain-containing protein [Oscillatoriaceae cyanobacterium]